MLIILEDLHWADELSLDVLGHLARRIAARPMLVAGAYRSDELYPSCPCATCGPGCWPSGSPRRSGCRAWRLDQTATMTSATLGRPVPAQLVAAIHERSDGIPLHVEEFLAAIGEDALTPQSGAAVQAAAVPDTLSDAVLSRARRLTALTREVASAAAVIGRSFDFDLLTAVTDAGPDDVAGALCASCRRHISSSPAPTRSRFDFRHALIRDTLYADTGLPLRRRLHERVARAASNAATAARSSPRTSSRRECAGPPTTTRSPPRTRPPRYRPTARRSSCAAGRCATCPAQLPALDRAGAVGRARRRGRCHRRQRAAAKAYQTAHELTTAAGDVRAAAALVPRMVAVAHLLGEVSMPVSAMLQAALDSLDGVADADRERARLHSAMAAAYLVDDRLDEAITHGERRPGGKPANRR